MSKHQRAPPPDDLQAKRAEVAELSCLLRAAEVCAEKVRSALEVLRQAPGPLVEMLRGRRSSPDAAKLLEELAHDVAAFNAQTSGCEPHIQAVLLIAGRLRGEAAKAEVDFVARDVCFEAKAYYDEKLQRLRAHPSRSGPGFKLESKVIRNRRKQKDAELAFQQASQAAADSADGVLSTRLSTSAVISELRRGLAAVLGRRTQDSGSPAAAPEAGSVAAADSAVLHAAADYMIAAVRAEVEGDSADSDDPAAGETAPAPLGAARSPVRWRRGDRLQVWSDSRSTWLDGHVEEVFESEGTDHGYQVLAGWIKVVSAAGMKYVTPDLAETSLRPLAAAVTDGSGVGP